MKRLIKHIALFIALIALSISTKAQNLQAKCGIDSTVILIGSQTHMHLSVTFDSKNGVPKVQWPFITDSLVSKVKVVSKSKIDTVTPDPNQPGTKKLAQDIIITSFDSGYYAIPPFQFVINGDTSHPLLTDPILFQVQTIAIDTTKGYKDIKAPMQAPFSWRELLPYTGWVALGLVLITVITLLITESTKKKKPEVVIPKAPPLPPHVKALKDLEELALKKLRQEGKVKEYHSGISDILRIYLEARFHVNAPEMTTDEILFALRRADMPNEQRDKLRNILVLADLVKFAKEQPLPHENENSLSLAIDFVSSTAPAPEPIQQPPAEVPQPNVPAV